MALAAPAFLLLLPLGALIWLLHGRKRQQVSVGSLRLWQQIGVATSGGRASWQRPKVSLAMLLQLVLFLCLVLALAGPYWSKTEQPEHWVLVLDRSASMQARDGTGSRFEAAVARMRSLVASADPIAVTRLSLISVGEKARLHAARLDNRPDALSAHWANLAPSYGSPDWHDAASRVEQVILPGDATRILLFTDGDEEAEAALSAVAPAELSVLRFGSPTPNAGLAVRLVASEDEGVSASLFGDVLVDALEAITVTVEFLASGSTAPLVWEEVTLKVPTGANTVPLSLDLSLPGSGLVTVRLPQDAAEFDNAAHFRVLAQPETLDVLYIGPGNQPLLLALDAVPGVNIFVADRLPADIKRFRLVIADGVALEREPQSNLVLIGGARLPGEAPAQAIVPEAPSFWHHKTALFRDIDPGALKVASAFQHADTSGWEELILAGTTPLLQIRQTPAGRQLRIAFDPAQSNWPDMADFAVFAANLVGWLGPMPGDALPQPCPVYHPCPVPAERVDLLKDATTHTRPSIVPVAPGAYALGDGSAGYSFATAVFLADESRQVSLPFEPAVGPFPDGSVWRATPWLLLLAALLAIAEAMLARSRSISPLAGKSGFLWLARLPKLAARLAVLVFIVLAWLNVPLPYGTRQGHSIVVASDADRLPGEEIAGSGLVTAGAAPRIAQNLDGTQTAVGPAHGDAVDLEHALDLALAMLPPDTPGRIALVAPLAQTIGNAGKALPDLIGRNVSVDLLADMAPPSNDVALLDLRVQGRVFDGDTVPLTALAYSDSARSADLRVMQGMDLVASETLFLAAGYNRLEMALRSVTEGVDEVRFELAIADAVAQNNARSTLIDVESKPRILVLAPEVEQGTALAELLDASGLSVDVLAADRAPWRMAQYLEWDALVLANVPAISLDTRQQLLIEDAVSRHGRGLLILGGENSFGPGGYLQTPLERLSPLSSKVPRDAPEAAIAFVLDRSGSMGQKVGDITRLDIARQATGAAIDLLGEESQVAIIAFDSQAQVPLPLQSAQNAEPIKAALDRMDPGGGTAILPGLEAAFQQLRGIEAPARHIVLMTDGLSTPGELGPVMAAITAEGITVSAVAIGEGADATALRQIAGLGAGTFHATTDFQALPSILSQEAMLLSGSPIEEGPAQPVWTAEPADTLRAMMAPLPAITGFVLTTAKPDATLSLTVADKRGEAMPLLATWRYGNGEVLALTTQGAGLWTRNWLDNAAYARLLGQAVRSALPASKTSGLTVDIERSGDEAIAYIDVLDADGNFEAPGAITATLSEPRPNGESASRPLRLTAVANGRFEARFTTALPGDYRIAVNAGDFSAQDLLRVDFSAALLPQTDNGALLGLVSSTEGRVLSRSDSFAVDYPLRWASMGGGPLWTLLALLTFLSELARRHGYLRRPRPTRQRVDSLGMGREIHVD